MSDTDLAFRRVAVRPLSPVTELGHVARACIGIVVFTCVYLGTDSPKFRADGAAPRGLLPYQTLIQSRPSLDQRMFRELQEGLLEAETRRSDNGEWPSPAELAAEGIPPFAFDPTRKGGPYDWRLIVDGTFVNYLGVPQRPGDPAWLVLVLEPTPGAAPDPAADDEEHDRLLDGTMLHVSTWVRTDDGGAMDLEQLVRMPSYEGWTQLFAVGPSQTPSTPPPTTSASPPFPAQG